MTKKTSFSERARKQIEEQERKAEEVRLKQLKEKRMQLIASGVKAYKANKMGEAVANYQAYLKLLEDWKGVPSGGLSPTVFDRDKELGELLTISGVYWDLARLYDQTKSADRKKDFAHYLGKYLLFSKGMPFQTVCAESLRKYVSQEKPRHRAEFRNAYRVLAPHATKCFVATALLDVTAPETHPRLRRFRDEVLMQHSAGRRFVSWYYRTGPSLASWSDKLPEPVRKLMGLGLDGFAGLLRNDREGSRSER
jgi:hypothetical protein